MGSELLKMLSASAVLSVLWGAITSSQAVALGMFGILSALAFWVESKR